MKRLFLILSLMVAVVALSSCNNCTSKQSTDEATTEVDAAQSEAEARLAMLMEQVRALPSSIEGTFVGVIPCADCPGINTALSIESDLSYAMIREYMERDLIEHEVGHIVSVDSDNAIIELEAEDGSMSYFKVVDGKLLLLLPDKSEPAEETRDLYFLLPRM